MLEEDLTPGEKLVLWRKRCQLVPKQAAKMYDVHWRVYVDWERDVGEVPSIKLRGLDPHEHYTVLRLRAKLSMRQLALRMGLEPAMIKGWEFGRFDNLKWLIDFWQQ